MIVFLVSFPLENVPINISKGHVKKKGCTVLDLTDKKIPLGRLGIEPATFHVSL